MCPAPAARPCRLSGANIQSRPALLQPGSCMGHMQTSPCPELPSCLIICRLSLCLHGCCSFPQMRFKPNEAWLESFLLASMPHLPIYGPRYMCMLLTCVGQSCASLSRFFYACIGCLCTCDFCFHMLSGSIPPNQCRALPHTTWHLPLPPKRSVLPVHA